MTKRILTPLLWCLAAVLTVHAENLKGLLRAEDGVEQFVVSTTDANRNEMLGTLMQILDSARTESGEADRAIVFSAMQAIDCIAQTSVPLESLKNYVDDPMQGGQNREQALAVFGRVAQRTLGPREMTDRVKVYLTNDCVFVAKQARELIAGTNTEQAAAILVDLVAVHRSTLPPAGFVVKPENEKDIERRFAAIFLDMRALKGMAAPAARAKAEETSTFLHETYKDGIGAQIVTYYEAESP